MWMLEGDTSEEMRAWMCGKRCLMYVGLDLPTVCERNLVWN